MGKMAPKFKVNDPLLRYKQPIPVYNQYIIDQRCGYSNPVTMQASYHEWTIEERLQWSKDEQEQISKSRQEDSNGQGAVASDVPSNT